MAVNPIFIPAPLDHPRLGELLALCPGATRPVGVPPSGWMGPRGNCYWNVLHQMSRAGGDLINGWMIHYWPGVLLQAQHHGVWRSIEGQLADVTERPPYYPREAATCFVADEGFIFNPQVIPSIKSVHVLLTEDSNALDYVTAYEAAHDLDASWQRILNGRYDLRSEKLGIARGMPPTDPAFSPPISGTERYNIQVAQIRAHLSRLKVARAIDYLLLSPPNEEARSAASLCHPSIEPELGIFFGD